MSDPEEKGPGRGRGKFTRPGVQADQEARIAAIEDFLEETFGEGAPGGETEEPSA